MKKQQNKIITHNRRRAFAWVACFGLLFAMLAMPMTPTMPRTQAEQWVWRGSCCSVSSSILAVPAHNQPGFLVLVQPVRITGPVLVLRTPKHALWPGFNSRAAPRV